MTGRHVLLISDSVSPLVSGETPLGVMGLARALAAGGLSAYVVSLAAPADAASMPGLARRLRTVKVQMAPDSREVALFEGKAPLSQAQLLVAGAEGRNRGESAVLLAETVRALCEDGLVKADIAIAWGETAALALAGVPAAVRLFVVPNGRVGGPLSPAESAVIQPLAAAGAPGGNTSLAELGAAFANAIVAPSSSAARSLEEESAFAERASDEPLVPARFGCDDPPHDPATDTALAANFSSKAPAGKLECRRALSRKYSLALGHRTLLLGTGQLRRGKGGEELLAALGSLGKLDVAVVIPGDGDPDLLEGARRLAIHSPGRMAVLEDDETAERIMRAAADAVLCADPDDRTARAPGLAQRYGALPIALDAGASRDYLVDYDVASATGSAILFETLDAYEIEGAIRRALALRAVADGITPLAQRLMETAPKWAQTAAAFEEICESFR